MDHRDKTIASRLRALPPGWSAVRSAALRYAGVADNVDSEGVIKIGHRPTVAPEAYAVRIYPPAPGTVYAKYENLHSVAIPEFIRSILHVANGLWIDELTIYGIPASMLKDPPMLDRTRLQCLDIATANTAWRAAFEAGPELFHFGSRVNGDESVGYFADAKARIHALSDRGRSPRKWTTLAAFFEAELATVGRASP